MADNTQAIFAAADIDPRIQDNINLDDYDIAWCDHDTAFKNCVRNSLKPGHVAVIKRSDGSYSTGIVYHYREESMYNSPYDPLLVVCECFVTFKLALIKKFDATHVISVNAKSLGGIVGIRNKTIADLAM